MSQVRFLLDEQIPVYLADAIRSREPAALVYQIGVDVGMPPKGTLDPGVLIFAEQNSLAIISFDKRTMRDHADDHLACGRHTWGLFLFPNGRKLSAGDAAEELVMIWSTSEAEEWIDRVEFLPF